MSRPNHKHNDPLKQLFENKQQPADDFEKEALQGFGMLNNEQAAFDLKAELDEKIEQELFAPKKQRPSNAYWVAAAALLLVAGLCIYFMLAPGAKVDQNQLALEQDHDMEAAAEKNTEQKAAVLEMAPPAPATTAAKTQELKVSAPQPAITEQHGFAGNGVAAPGDLAFSAAQNQPAPKQEADSLAMYKDAEPAREVAAAPLAKTDDADDYKAEEKEVSTKAAKKKASARERAYATTPLAAAGGAEQLVNENSLPQNCYYKGGEAALYKDLSQALAAKDLDKHFEAILFINNKGLVERVEYSKNTILYDSEQKDITAVIKKLPAFSFIKPPAKGQLVEYKIVR